MARIAVIEDESAILDNVLQTLTLEGYEVRGASNGRAGVKLVRDYRPDLVLCDIMMPMLDGYGVLMEMRSDPDTANIPVIFLTALADRDSLRRGMVLGADDYVSKPFTVPELLESVRGRLERQAAQVREAERRMADLRDSVMLMMMPHELRTPLMSILGYSELLVSDAPQLTSDRVVEMARAIQRAGLRLNRLVENLLIYAQIELLRAEPQRAGTMRRYALADPLAAVEAVALEKAESAGRANDLTLRLAPLETLQVIEDNLRKIVAELLDNAFRFSVQGTPVLVAGTVEGEFYVLHLSDQGRGMSPEQVTSISAYAQFDRRLHEQQGMGLGLAIARGLTELHGGKFALKSTPGQGTTVRVALPIRPE